MFLIPKNTLSKIWDPDDTTASKMGRRHYLDKAAYGIFGEESNHWKLPLMVRVANPCVSLPSSLLKVQAKYYNNIHFFVSKLFMLILRSPNSKRWKQPFNQISTSSKVKAIYLKNGSKTDINALEAKILGLGGIGYYLY